MTSNANTHKIYNEVVDKLPLHLQGHPDVIQSVEDRIGAYVAHENNQIQNSNPFNDWSSILEEYERDIDNQNIEVSALEKAVSEFSRFAEFAQIPANKKYWSERVSNIKLKNKLEESSQFKVSRKNKQDDDTHLLYSQLMQEWRKRLDTEVQNWELAEVQRLKSAFMQAIEEWVAYLKQISELIDDLGMDLGYFLDFSEGQTSLSDIQTLKNWLNKIKDDQGIKEICKILGRIKQVGHSTEIKRTETIEIQNRWIPDANSKEEIVGIKIGNEIEHVIPSELSLLSSPETAILFDLKFVESQLMCFEMMGNQNIDETILTTKEEQVKAEEPKGPIILCIDTSGSMHGSPEYVAKAITLHMVNLARQEKRDCYLINFSTQIETLDFSSNMSFSALLGFLQKSFHGGTDVAPALEHALIKMTCDTYSNADLVIISDFVMPHLPNTLLNKIQDLRDTGNKFHSLCVSKDFIPERLRTHFDQEWVFNPYTSSVKEIINFSEAL